ncbi:hypothetical protein E2C01_038656 [Portunus trituberculatus]|uniref:Uncharacterized protein n=1 Tax=Portunus trituberculatus TaxID=210409 RepID=A0A5B7FKN3_PORTR|nr:hypothetical protein [Portunus trituberculatus]
MRLNTFGSESGTDWHTAVTQAAGREGLIVILAKLAFVKKKSVFCLAVLCLVMHSCTPPLILFTAPAAECQTVGTHRDLKPLDAGVHSPAEGGYTLTPSSFSFHVLSGPPPVFRSPPQHCISCCLPPLVSRLLLFSYLPNRVPPTPPDPQSSRPAARNFLLTVTLFCPLHRS